jgi:hypothetical protein
VRRALAVGVVLAAAGCLTPSSPSAPADLARVATRPVAPLAPAGPDAPVPVPAPPPTPPPLPVMAEVEIGGTVTRPPNAKGDATAWIVDAPCWHAGARAFGAAKTVADKFFLEVYVPQGTQLWVCAALGDPSKPLEIYGQADRAPLLGKGTGEVTFIGLSVRLAKGKKVTAPGKR